MRVVINAIINLFMIINLQVVKFIYYTVNMYIPSVL